MTTESMQTSKEEKADAEMSGRRWLLSSLLPQGPPARPQDGPDGGEAQPLTSFCSSLPPWLPPSVAILGADACRALEEGASLSTMSGSLPAAAGAGEGGRSGCYVPAALQTSPSPAVNL